jgi:hypothetical protein
MLDSHLNMQLFIAQDNVLVPIYSINGPIIQFLASFLFLIGQFMGWIIYGPIINIDLSSFYKEYGYYVLIYTFMFSSFGWFIYELIKLEQHMQRLISEKRMRMLSKSSKNDDNENQLDWKKEN